MLRLSSYKLTKYVCFTWFNVVEYEVLVCEPIIVYTAGTYPFNAAITWVVDFVAETTGLPIITKNID
jgi:hypothetical protein